ncbi:hypothetical protein GCM10010279_39760 [Streptomyces mutabilis]|nr:hypothetical protein GCM10010279_39760 [Streptomyces mutabilis]
MWVHARSVRFRHAAGRRPREDSRRTAWVAGAEAVYGVGCGPDVVYGVRRGVKGVYGVGCGDEGSGRLTPSASRG